jgi:Protein of unknown function (DUF3237)
MPEQGKFERLAARTCRTLLKPLILKEVMERLARGENVSPAEYYLRVTPYFETASEKYGWLNRVITVGYGARMAGGAIYQVFEIL